jgi:hypothetical protein
MITQPVLASENMGLETVFEPSDPNQRVVAESILHEAGIPFESKNEDLQDLFGWGQIGGTNLVIGPVKLQVPAEFAAEARALLENGVEVEAGELLEETPAELEQAPVPPDPRLVKVRRLALLSVICSFFVMAPFGPLLGIGLGFSALLLAREGATLRWKLFAGAGVLYGLWSLLGLVSLLVVPDSFPI